MNTLEEAFENYLNSDDSLAMQIDSPWGSGKTYTVQHSLTKIAENNKYNVVYMSVNGMNHLKSIEEKLNKYTLISKSIGNKNQKYYKYFNGILNVIDSGLFSNNISNKVNGTLSSISQLLADIDKGKISYEKTLIFVDDFERCNVEIQDLMGLLSITLYSWHCKMVIISNESEIRSEKYLRSKEKLINKTIAMKVDYYRIAYKILNNKLSDEVSNEILNWICELTKSLIDILNMNNIRTLLSIISSFKQLNALIVQSNLTNDKGQDFLLKSGYLSIFIYTNMIRENLNINASWLSMYIFNENKKEKDYLDNIKSKLFNYMKYFNLQSEIATLVSKNYMNINNYIDSLELYFDTKIDYEFNKIFSELKNFRLKNDEEVLQNELDIIEYYHKNDLSIENKMDMYDYLLFLDRNNLLLLDFKINDLRIDIESFIEKSNNFEYYHKLVDFDKSHNSNFKTFISELIKKKTLSSEKNEVCNYLEKMLENKQEIAYPNFKNDLSFKNIFSFIMSQKDIAKKLTNTAIIGINNSLEMNSGRYELYDCKDIPSLLDFNDMISDLKNETKDNVMLYNINLLQKNLDKLLNNNK